MALFEKFEQRELPDVVTDCSGESLTEQSHKEDCDVNRIIERFTRTGQLNVSAARPIYGDFTDVPQDFAACLAKVNAAQAAFDSLPAAVKKNFDYSVQKMLEFLSDDKNRDRAVELGLIEKTAAAAAVSSSESAAGGV